MSTDRPLLRQLSVISSMDPRTGGPAQAIRYLFPLFQSYGCIPEVVCLDAVDGKSYGDLNLRIIPLGGRVGLWQYNSKLYRWLIKCLPEYDFVIIHGLWLYHSFAVTKVIQELKKNPANNIPKVYVMCHGMLDPWFQKSPTRIFKAIRNWFYWKLTEQQVIANADGILFTCEEEMRLASTTFNPYKPKKEFNVGYGITIPPPFSTSMLELFQQQCPEITGNNYILFLGRIHHKKGLDLLINAYSALKKDPAYKNILPNLVVAGPGMESNYGIKIQRIVDIDSSLKGVVHFVGMLTGNAKWGALYGCDTFILPSHQENFGIAVVEALACSKPVIISNQVNIWKEISEGGGGLVADDNLSGVVKVLKQWLDLSENERYLMNSNALKVFHDKFVVDKAAKNILNVFANAN